MPIRPVLFGATVLSGLTVEVCAVWELAARCRPQLSLCASTHVSSSGHFSLHREGGVRIAVGNVLRYQYYRYGFGDLALNSLYGRTICSATKREVPPSRAIGGQVSVMVSKGVRFLAVVGRNFPAVV